MIAYLLLPVMDRRHYLAGLGTVGVASVAGCLDMVFGDELVFEASPARVPDAVADDTGFRHAGTSEDTIERTVEAGGESRDIVATNVRVEYEKGVSGASLDIADDVSAGLFVALTTPQASVLGQSFNPLAHLSATQVVERAQGRYGDLEDLSRQDEGDITIQGQETTRTEYLTSARLGDQRIDARLHVTEFVELGDDFVMTLGLYPDLVDEETNVIRLMESVEASD